MDNIGFLQIFDMPIFFNSFWPIPIYFLLFGNNTKSLLCRNDKLNICILINNEGFDSALKL